MSTRIYCRAIYSSGRLRINMNIISLFGIVVLSGVEVNDSLVLIHRINDLIKQGLKAFDFCLRPVYHG